MQAYEFSQLFNFISKIIALIINVGMIMPIQIKEMRIVRDGIPYVGALLLLMNILVSITICISFFFVYIRSNFSISFINYYTFANHLSVVYVLYSIVWLILYRNYYFKKK